MNYLKKSSLLVCLFLFGCSQREDLAPVVEVNWKAAHSKEVRHVVVRGETLYAIAFRYDLDYRELAALNHLQGNNLKIGQVLNLHSYSMRRPQSVQSTYTPRVTAPKIYSAPPSVAPTTRWVSSSGRWVWPAQGRVVTNFLPQQGKKGIDIAGKRGDKILATSSGVVAYAGSGLVGYGNLIIIKHDATYLTAYGNNLRNLVHEGQKIKAGQIIAEMGMVDRRFWGVHFEIRKTGQPVNPLNYLQRG